MLATCGPDPGGLILQDVDAPALHICIQQTALDLLAIGLDVYLAVDAIGSRHPHDHEVALRRMERAGVQLTTTESTMFEWCEIAGTPEFKQISRLAIQTGPNS